MCIYIYIYCSIYTYVYTVHTMIKQCRKQQDELQQNLLKVHPDRNLPKNPQISIIDFGRSAKKRPGQNKNGFRNGHDERFLGAAVWKFQGRFS